MQPTGCDVVADGVVGGRLLALKSCKRRGKQVVRLDTQLPGKTPGRAAVPRYLQPHSQKEDDLELLGPIDRSVRAAQRAGHIRDTGGPRLQI